MRARVQPHVAISRVLCTRAQAPSHVHTHTRACARTRNIISHLSTYKPIPSRTPCLYHPAKAELLYPSTRWQHVLKSESSCPLLRLARTDRKDIRLLEAPSAGRSSSSAASLPSHLNLLQGPLLSSSFPRLILNSTTSNFTGVTWLRAEENCRHVHG